MARARIAGAIAAIFVTVMLSAFVGATVAAAAAVPAYSGNPKGVTLGMIGDSITYRLETPLHQALDPTFQSSIVASGGASIASLTADGSIGAMAAMNPAVIVFNLGTNDLVQVAVNPTKSPLRAYEASYAAMRAKFKGCAVVTTINTNRTAGGNLETVQNAFTAYDNDARKFNSWLRAHYSHVVDWDALTMRWRNAGTSRIYMSYDGVHPTAKGQVQLVRMIRTQADRCSSP